MPETALYAFAAALLSLLGSAAALVLCRSTALRERAAVPLAKDADERLDKLEREFPEWRLAMEGLLDRAHDALDTAEKKRARAATHEARARGPQIVEPEAPLTRADQLRVVRARFEGRS